MALLTGTKEKALQLKATINWQSFFDDVIEYLEEISPEMWRKIFRPLVRGLVIDQVKRWALLLGMTFDVEPLFARSWYAGYIARMPIPIRDTTAKAIGELIDKALNQGWSIPQMQTEIENLFGIWQDYRTERIVRTETIRASNAGSVDQFKEWGVKKHEWLATQDSRVRDAHAKAGGKNEAHGQIVEIGTPFIVGGEALYYPGDPNGSPENTINCRCVTLPVIEGFDDD